MSPEQFHDALNYLDDDLIAQTDELRQGKRVLQTRPTARQVIAWVAPAACLALVIGLAPRLLPAIETENLANTGIDQMYQEAGQPPKALEDYATAAAGSVNRQESITSTWVTQIMGDISLQVPTTWSCHRETGDDGSYYLLITPPNEEDAIRIGYDPNFGVCGTGLTEKQTTIAGMNASVGYYDGSSNWSFMTFPDLGQWYVVQKDGVSEWWGVYGDEAMAILETIVIE